jgi:NADH-quinone oxidoreductase subunit G
MSTEPIKVTINGQEFQVAKGARLIDVCREKGFGIPSFCYYQDLELQASCRMCLVRIEKMPKLQTSCTIICTDGMVVTTQSEEVEKAQRAMGEFLLANHPLDCPVCDRGGECELQEVIFDWGDIEQRFSERKNAQPEKYLSPIVANDPQRCILCKRCTRVCSEWMGEDAIEAGNRGVNTVIGTYGGWLNCSQCGNCIEVCPTGTLLDGVYRHETRPWELDQTVSTDPYSSDGMQLSLGTRNGVVHRIVARDRYVNGLNGEFLDVKARFAHGFVNHASRLKTPMIRYSKGGNLIPATWDQAIAYVANKFKEIGAVGVIASPRLTNESIFALRRFAETKGSEGYAVSEVFDLAPIFDNLSVPLATHADILAAQTIVLIGGEPEEEQTYTAKQVRQAVKNHKAKLVVISDRLINLAAQSATEFVHVNSGSLEAFAMAAVSPDTDNLIADKMGVESSTIDGFRKLLFETQGTIVIMLGSELSSDALSVIAANAASLVAEGRRVLLHPLARYNNSVGANDVMVGRKSVDEVVKNSNALLIGGSLQDASVLDGKEFVVVQELFETETTAFADVVFPASSYVEVDGTYTNNAGNIQRVRKAIDNLHQSKPDWMITTLIAREMGIDFGYDFSASMVFRAVADAVPAYGGLRYPALKDESNPVQAKYDIKSNLNVSEAVARLRDQVSSLPDNGTKNNDAPRIGHKLHRLTVMTSKTEQFHLLAHGNPKPENLLVSPLVQFNLDGTERKEGVAEAESVTLADRAAIGVNN